MPYAGVVPPEPGFAVTAGETYYVGSISGSTTVPVGQNLTLGIDLKASFTPTGEYDQNDLANLSMNTWTFIPGVAYTRIFPKANVELSGSWAMTFDTENAATDYQNGILSDLELMAVKRFKCGAGIGLVGSWIVRVEL